MVLYRICACVCAAVCAYCIATQGAVAVLEKYRRYIRAARCEVSVRSACACLFSFGVAPFKRVSKLLLRSVFMKSRIAKLCNYLKKQHIACTEISCLSVVLCVLTFFVLSLSIALSSVLSAFVVVCACVLVCFLPLRNFEEKQKQELHTSAIVAIQTLRACFQSGMNLEQSFEYVAQETTHEISNAFHECAQNIAVGRGVQTALQCLQNKLPFIELKLLVVAIEIQQQTGGKLGEVFESAQTALQNQSDLQRMLATKTAQAKLSARIVGVMPFVLLGIFSLVSKDFLAPFFSSLEGFALFLAALLLLIVGGVLVKRSMCIEGGQS